MPASRCISWGFEVCADDVRGFCDTLGIARPVVYGHSLGVVGELARIDCPTLVCVGELDPATPVAAAREIADALPQGSARLEVVQGAGHFVWKDAPDRYWPFVTEFVTSTT
ncbi:MAG TPA: alpha/beta hydrolase [Actinomycetota bacterium]